MRKAGTRSGPSKKEKKRGKKKKRRENPPHRTTTRPSLRFHPPAPAPVMAADAPELTTSTALEFSPSCLFVAGGWKLFVGGEPPTPTPYTLRVKLMCPTASSTKYVGQNKYNNKVYLE